MATITWPAALLPRSFSLVLQTSQRVHASDYGGVEQAVDMLNDRWLASLSVPVRNHAAAAELEAFIASLRGMVNNVAMYHRARSVPRGTLRGTPALESAAAQGADTLSIQAVAGETLLAGDMLGLDGLLLQVASPCTADVSGVMSVPIVNRLRRAVADATAVTWSAPTVLMRVVNQPRVPYLPGYADAVDFELAEVVS